MSKKQASAPQETGAPDIPEHFEKAIAELESIVASMERGDLTLEDSLAAYERGVRLSRACQAQLENAQQQVNVLEQDLLRPLQDQTRGSEPS